MKKKKLLITGAGGNIGREALRMLVKRTNEYEVYVFDVDTPKNRELFDRYYGKINVVFGDITKASTLIPAVEGGVDFVIHMAAIIPPLAHDNPELAETVNVEGTRNLIEAIKVYAPEAFLIFASSVSVYGDRLKDPYIKVGDPLIPAEGDNYAETKIKMEEMIQESGLKYSIFRLSAIMGAGNHQMSGLMFEMPLEQLFEICTPKDTARAFVFALEHQGELENKIFNLGGGSACVTTYEEFLSKNFEIYGLGALDFPLYAFAKKNFHCGYYEDGDDLEEILHFRRDTLEDYYDQLHHSIPFLQKAATKLVAKFVKSYLLSKSEPYQAWLNKDLKKMAHYF